MKSIHSRGDQKHSKYMCALNLLVVQISACLPSEIKKENQRKKWKFLTSRKTIELASKYQLSSFYTFMVIQQLIVHEGMRHLQSIIVGRHHQCESSWFFYYCFKSNNLSYFSVWTNMSQSKSIRGKMGFTLQNTGG